MTPAELVRHLRTRLGLTQTALADALGVHVRTVQHWERGGEDPTRGYAPGAEDIERLVQLAGVRVEVTREGWQVG